MNKGFSLVELLVAVVVFLIAATAAVGVFSSALRNQRYILASQQLLDQSSYALEYMSKSLRMAKENEGNECGIGSGNTYGTPAADSLKIKSQRKECQTFSLAGSAGNQQLVDSRKEVGGEEVYSYLPLLSEDFNVQDFGVFIMEDSSQQPRVTIMLDIVGRQLKDKPRMRLQTTVSQRDLKQ